MDIAEIRKKAKLRQAASREGSLVSPEPQAVEPPAAVAAELFVAGRQSGAAPELAGAESALDRLFSGTNAVPLGTEDAYRTTLMAREEREETDFLQCLAFRVGPEEYALDIARINEIIKPRECTDIPRVPEFILGLISLRGVVVPIIDLRRRFKLGEGRLTPESRIIVCREGDVTAGLLVDSITQVLHFATDQIEPPPAILSGIDRYLLDGVGRYQGRMVILLHLATVLDVAMA